MNQQWNYLILYFDDFGINVTKDNSLNFTGRHRSTGSAAVILKNAYYYTHNPLCKLCIWQNGIYMRPDLVVPE